ncbi:MAG: AI-2E family transporter [Phycisphaerae bacterium]|nr:AI-2E family transporter [Phycisphaerae bacterium]
MGDVDKNMQTPIPASAGLSGPTRFLITAAAFVVVVAGMRAAIEIIIPFLLAVFLAIICTPALFWLKNRGISTVFAILIVSLVIMAVGLMVGTILTTSIADFTNDLPQYTNQLNTKIQDMEVKWNNWLDKQREKLHMDDANDETNTNSTVPALSEDAAANPEPDTPAATILTDIEEKEPLSISQFLDAQAGIKLMRDLLAQLGNILTKGFLIYLTTIFILLEASILPGKIKAAMKNNAETFDNLAGVADDVKKYLAMKTAISLITGALVTGWLIILKVKYPIVWGLIAFLLNFVPNIGSIIAAVPACILAFLQFGLGTAALAAVGYLVVNIVLGNIIEPRLMGQRLGLSTLVVFLSLVFWGWVLGPIGMLLSVPLTMTVKIALQSHPDTRKLAILLDSQKPPVRKKKKST